MSCRSCLLGLLAAIALTPLLTGRAAAQTAYYWNSGLTAGTWDTTSPNWSTSGYSTSTTQTWVNGNVARFQPPSGGSTTVTLGGVISFAGITAQNGGLTTINPGNGGSLTLGNSSSTAVGLDADFGATLTINAAITGGSSNYLSVGGTNGPAGAGMVVLAGANTYTGGTAVINGGVLQFNSAAAIPSVGTVNVYGNGTVIAGGTLDLPTLLSRLDPTSVGTVGLTGNGTTVSTNLDFSAFTGGLSLGAAPGASVTYTGTLTPANNTYHLGGGGGTLTVASNLTYNPTTGESRSLVVGGNGESGTVVLTGVSNYSGSTTVAGGVLQYNSAGSLPAGTGRSINLYTSTCMVAAGGTLDPAALLARVNLYSLGALGLVGTGTTVSSNLDFSAQVNGLRLAAAPGSSVTYTGTLTPLKK